MPETQAIRLSESMPGGLRFEPTDKWIRAELAGATVVDTRGALLIWEPGRIVPVYAVPRRDFDTEVLAEPDPSRPAAEHTAPISAHWTVESGDRRIENAAWSYEDPVLSDHVTLRWDALDRWLEEEEEVIGHPRDPFKRIDVRASSRHVVVRRDDTVLADSHRPTLLFETGLPVRFYLPFEDLSTELLVPSGTRTVCAYKGRASYWSVRIGDRVHPDLAWTYPDPLSDNSQITDLVSFWDERVDVELDGESRERPRTPFSSTSSTSPGSR